MSDWLCNYCGAVFPKRMDNGSCPCCGGPRPKKLEEPHQQEIVTTKYHYVERPVSLVDYTPIGYYYPPNPSLKSKIYSTLGFKITTGLFAVLALILLYTFVQAFKIGAKDSLTDETLRKVAPTAHIIESSHEGNFNWLDVKISSWLSSSESIDLRDQENVVNLIVLDQDEIRIAANQTIEFDSTWEQSRPYFIEAISVIDTAVIVQIGGTKYNINIYQPLVWKEAPQVVVIIDHEGVIWNKDTSNITLSPITEIELPFTIKPNSQLEISFSKQR